jgi:hypothetical protein
MVKIKAGWQITIAAVFLIIVIAGCASRPVGSAVNLQASQAALTTSNGINIDNCNVCHPKTYHQWLESGHSISVTAAYTFPDHDNHNPLRQDCVRCMGLPGGKWDAIGNVVQPLNFLGPWKLVGAYAAQPNAPVNSCENCHKPHNVQAVDAVMSMGLKKGMNYWDESTFYRGINTPSNPYDLYRWNPIAQKYVLPPDIPPVELPNGTWLQPTNSLVNRICYSCHSTAWKEHFTWAWPKYIKGMHSKGTKTDPMANWNKPSPLTSAGFIPKGYGLHSTLSDKVFSGDDRTLVGVHQGLECVACHMQGGNHTMNPMNSCEMCHGTNTKYVESLNTSYKNAKLSGLNISDYNPLNIHFLHYSALFPGKTDPLQHPGLVSKPPQSYWLDYIKGLPQEDQYTTKLGPAAP